MNSVLILSDSHGFTTEITKIKERHNLTENIHCGDSELQVNAQDLQGFHTVRGNTDWSAPFPENEILEIAGLRFLITHGHLYGVKHSLRKLQYKAKEVNADIVCFGHSHIAYGEKLDDRLFINPGSIRLPKKSRVATYAILEWETRAEITLKFYSVAGEIVKTTLFNL